MAVVSSGPTLAIAHEWLVRYAGSERVVEQMRAEFPEARLHTTLLRPDALPPDLRVAETGLLQRLTRARLPHEPLVPAMPLDWRFRRQIDDVDVVVSSSHACAKAVRAVPGIPHLCYCHTPMRYAWDFASEAGRFPRVSRPLVRSAMGAFRRWDRSTAERVTAFLANSSAVAARIRNAYGREATVLAPPVDTEFFTPGDAGTRRDEFLYVGRLVPYKRADLAVDAFAGLPHRLLVVGEGPLRAELEARAGENVEFVGAVDDDALREHYRRARALVFPANEDFGIVMAEAQACGTPVISFAEGARSTSSRTATTGWLIRRQSVEDLRVAVGRAAVEQLDEATIRAGAERFSRARFREGFRAAVEAVAAQRPR